MFKRSFEKLNADVSVLGFGMMRLPEKDGAIDLDETRRIVRYALDNGLNYIDTAYFYHEGKSEDAVRYALEGLKRESFYLADKMPGWLVKTLADAERIFDDQLKKCGVDYFDFYLCHALSTQNFLVYKSFLLDFLKQKKSEGKIKRLGFSFHGDMKALKHICAYHDWDFAQIQFNYYDYDAFSKEQYDYLTEKGIPVIIMEPVRGGALAMLNDGASGILKSAEPDASVASWAIRFAMTPENVLTVLSGMSSFEQVKDNIATAVNFQPMTKDRLDTLKNALDFFKSSDIVPCTACRYCMDCPFGVDIPKSFAEYNNYALYKNKPEYLARVKKLGNGAASSCKNCGVCVKKCPQGINIPERLSKIAKIPT